MRRTTRDAEETRALGRRLGERLRPGDLVGISGELGAGKTVLAQGICRGLEVEEPVCSPTFTLVQEYRGRCPVWHLDAYRLRGEEELIDLGWEEVLAGDAVVLIEWPERISGALPAERLDVVLTSPGEEEREVLLTARGARMARLLRALRRGPAGAET